MISDEVQLRGLNDEVTIERDRWGIPHVRAHTLADLFFGQGFATAADRSWHLEWDRRRAYGTLAAATGNNAHVVADAFARRARLGDVARRGYQQLTEAQRAPLDAHAAGINAYLDWAAASAGSPPMELTHLGIGASRWEPQDAVAVFQIRHVLFATWQTKLWRARVLAALGPQAMIRFNREGTWGETPVIVPAGVRQAVGELAAAGLFAPGAAGPGGLSGSGVLDGLGALTPLGLNLSGSNCWVVNGSRTGHGSPIIVGDPHRALEVPNVYYQVRLSCPEEGVEAAGFSFPGVPGIQHFGQNGRVAWGVTNAMADYQDLYVERLPDAVTDRRVEQIEVAGADPVPVECLLSAHGPVVVGGSEMGVGLALASTGLVDPAGSLATLVPLLQARTVDELDRLLTDWVEPLNNWVMADRDGAIGYRTAGKVPVRPEVNTWLPVPGWDPTFNWSGMIPDNELPRQRDPDVEAIVTANQRITTRDYPHLLGSDCYGASRAQRIWDRLEEIPLAASIEQNERGGVGVGAALAAIHGDTVSRAGLHFAALSGDELLARWDGSMDARSAAAALYATARDLLVRRIIELLPAELRRNPFSAWEPAATALPTEQRVDAALDGWLAAEDLTVLEAAGADTPGGWRALVVDAVSAGRAELSARFGSDPSGWAWGDLHHLTPLHPLGQQLGEAVRPESGPLSGGSGCVMATNQLAGISYAALTGSTARYLWDLADPDRSGWVVPLGASGDPASSHFADQMGPYVDVELLAVVSPPVSERRLRPA
ncbi:MAG: penicillin acylase family protein [Acidimicrobiales bacterium]